LIVISQREPLDVGINRPPQIVCNPLPHVGCKVLLCVSAHRVSYGYDKDGDAGEDENVARRGSGGRHDEFMNPAMLILALEKVVQNDLERPRLKEAGYAFASDSEKAEPKLAPVGTQNIQDAQAGLAV